MKAGAALTEQVAERRAWRRLRTAILVAVLLATVPMLWLILPVLPRHVFAAHQDKLPHKEFHEEFGWDDRAAQVAAVYRAPPAHERARARIMTESYGEAAALDLLGPRHGLPRVTSPHNNYYFWGPPDTDVVIAIAWSRRRLDAVFDDVQEVARIANSLDIRNQSSSQTIYICRRPSKPWPQIWEELRFFVQTSR